MLLSNDDVPFTYTVARIPVFFKGKGVTSFLFNVKYPFLYYGLENLINIDLIRHLLVLITRYVIEDEV